MRFKDKVVVITGSARGIGFATAEMAAKEGATIVVCDLDPAAVKDAAAKVEKHGGRVLGVAGDVSDLNQVRKNVDDVMQAFGRIDVLVNNAAMQAFGAPEDLTAEQWQRQLNVVLTGPFFWSQTVGKVAMIPARKGSIVNLGSGASLAGLPKCAGYVSAKHGVIGLTRALAVDWGQHNIRVNCVCPGLTFTELSAASARFNPEMMRQRELRIPLGRGAQPDEIAHAILYLASDESGSIHGQTITVDGGTLALSSGYSPPRD